VEDYVNQLIEEMAALVEAACAAPSNAFGYGIWSHHITQVVANGRRLARLFGADAEIVELAALLHDYSSICDATLYQEHHRHSARVAGELLGERGYPGERIAAIQHCIATHRGSMSAQRQTVEAVCLANADALSHIQQVPSLLYLAYVRRQMSIDAGAAWVAQKLERTWRKLDPQVQALAQPDYAAALLVLASGQASGEDNRSATGPLPRLEEQ
jgi:uncharacterized protein